MVVPLYKPLGVSTHSFVKAYGESIGEKVSHTGSLDPLADGVVVVLTGEDRFKKEEYSDWKKTYDFSILFGVETDTHDLLGLVVRSTNHDCGDSYVTDMIKSITAEFVGSIQQEIPRFSAKRLMGKSYFGLARDGVDFKPGFSEVNVFDLVVTGSRLVSGSELEEAIISKIDPVVGDFRQAQICKSWQTYFHNQDKNRLYLIVSMQAITSRRTYVRGLVRDIGLKLQMPTTTYSITRSANGVFKVGDCVKFTA